MFYIKNTYLELICRNNKIFQFLFSNSFNINSYNFSYLQRHLYQKLLRQYTATFLTKILNVPTVAKAFDESSGHVFSVHFR